MAETGGNVNPTPKQGISVIADLVTLITMVGFAVMMLLDVALR
jgi:hypothetical protein